MIAGWLIEPARRDVHAGPDQVQPERSDFVEQRRRAGDRTTLPCQASQRANHRIGPSTSVPGCDDDGAAGVAVRDVAHAGCGGTGRRAPSATCCVRSFNVTAIVVTLSRSWLDASSCRRWATVQTRLSTRASAGARPGAWRSRTRRKRVVGDPVHAGLGVDARREVGREEAIALQAAARPSG